MEGQNMDGQMEGWKKWHMERKPHLQINRLFQHPGLDFSFWVVFPLEIQTYILLFKYLGQLNYTPDITHLLLAFHTKIKSVS